MSGTPNKRAHEDSGGHSSLSRYTHTQDDSGTFSKIPNPPTAPNDYHPANFETGQDSRMPKVPRTEIRETDNRRSPLIPMYRTSSSSINEPQSDHAVNNEANNNMKVENRDVKTESKEIYQGAKSENKDVTRYTSKADDHKDTKYERDVYSDKDAYNHRTWKYPDGGNLHYNAHGQMEIPRENMTTEEKKDFTEINENVSENKVDVKNEERVKERDRKRKDGKNREFGEKDPTKEERETDRKDSQKDKKEKEGLQTEKEEMDVSSSRALDQDNNNNNKAKDVEKESKDRKMEKDVENENEKPDDGGIEVEGGFNHGVQQRKRMIRPAGSPQIANRDPRFRSRNQDNDGSTGKSDVSSVVYRVGECMQELIKLWKEYEPSENSKNGPTLEIRIPAEHVSATNRQVKGGQLWGTDIYTDDSDLVAVLMHTGFCRPTASPPPPAIQELRATVRVLPPQDCYVSTLRNNVRSRAWGAAIGCSFKVERCYIVKKGGGTIDLEPCLTHTSTVEPTLAPVVVERTMTTRAAASNALRQQRFVREVTLQYNLCNEPWIKYSISAIADKGLKKPLFTSARLKKGEVLYLESRIRRYELCFNGEKVKAAHGNEMETNGVESDTINNNNNMMDVFRWSECKKPLPQTVMRSIGIPLPPEHLQVLEEHLDWEDIQWSQTGVWISGKEYPLSRVHFLSPV